MPPVYLSSLPNFVYCGKPPRRIISAPNPPDILYPCHQTFFFQSTSSSNAELIRDAYKHTWLPFLTVSKGEAEDKSPAGELIKVGHSIISKFVTGYLVHVFHHSLWIAFLDAIRDMPEMAAILRGDKYETLGSAEVETLGLISQLYDVVVFYFSNLYQLQISIQLRSGFWSRARYRAHPVMRAFQSLVLHHELKQVAFGDTAVYETMRTHPDFRFLDNVLPQKKTNLFFTLVPLRSYVVPPLQNDLVCPIDALTVNTPVHFFVDRYIQWKDAPGAGPKQTAGQLFAQKQRALSYFPVDRMQPLSAYYKILLDRHYYPAWQMSDRRAAAYQKSPSPPSPLSLSPSPSTSSPSTVLKTRSRATRKRKRSPRA